MMIPDMSTDSDMRFQRCNNMCAHKVVAVGAL